MTFIARTALVVRFVPFGCFVVGLLVLTARVPARAQWTTLTDFDSDLLAVEESEPEVGYITSNRFVDADAFIDDHYTNPGAGYYWQAVPAGLIYESYLANLKESRLSGRIIDVKDGSTFFDANVGGRIGLLRYGTVDVIRPEGFQIDVEGSAHLRLDIPEEVDVRSADYRGGIVATWGDCSHQTKFGYYHLSSHLGDEFLLKNPGFERLNYARDVLVLGRSIYLTDFIRIYGEAGWAFYTQESEPWEFQFGLEYAPFCRTGVHGAPFVALNGHLREEVNYGGGFSFQAGWAWRGRSTGSLFRIGFHYYNGESSQYSFFDDHDQQIGFGTWYDF